MPTPIIVVGLGPGAWEQVTLEARAVLDAATTVWLRTTTHPTAVHLPQHLRVESFDALYERENDFASIYRQIAESLLDLATAASSDEPLVYAVPGHPLVGEASVRHLIAGARTAGVPVRIVAGLSFLEPVCTALEIDPLQGGLQILDGTDLLGVGEMPGQGGDGASEPFYFSPYALPVPPAAFPALQGLSTLLPTLITQVYNDRVAGAVKLALLEKYPADHPTTLVIAAGVPGAERVEHVPLAELDHGHRLDHLACVYLPPLDPLAHPRDLDALIYLMGRLRGPGGCPWDREQDHQSLRRYLLEETHETLDAIDSGDLAALAEELGDVLLQVVFHAQVGVSAEEFTLGDVVAHIVTKLVRRHPHVFGEVEVANAAGVVQNWQTIKAAEKQARQAAGPAPADDAGLEVTALLRSVPRSMPALTQTQQISERAAQAGFEWDQMGDVFAKVHEELEEVRTADDPEHRAEELGDLLFTLVNVARWWGLNTEETLRAANRKFIARFTAMERLVVADGKQVRGMTGAALEPYWQAAKQAERAG
ncbi:MAG TPA: nucleoside triphosphate pyrophosphohydrolase [Chloroflexia bacterium]|nr:nucleoside triphosphate pyrophosphohydrolase [Chloroflexia bacterium]